MALETLADDMGKENSFGRYFSIASGWSDNANDWLACVQCILTAEQVSDDRIVCDVDLVGAVLGGDGYRLVADHAVVAV